MKKIKITILLPIAVILLFFGLFPLKSNYLSSRISAASVNTAASDAVGYADVDSLWHALHLELDGTPDTLYLDGNLLRFVLHQSAQIRIEGVYDMENACYYASVAPYKVYFYGNYRLVTRDYSHWQLYERVGDKILYEISGADKVYIVNAAQPLSNMGIYVHNAKQNTWEFRRPTKNNRAWAIIANSPFALGNTLLDSSIPSGTFNYDF